MKYFLSILFFAAHVAVFAQEDSMQVVTAPTLTEKGKPAGEKISQKINKDGGKLVSADGRVELLIPPDAVSSKTNISIQPVTNTLAPGSALAYELQPAGITFQKPLQITFHYSDKEAAGLMPQLKAIAWQDETGQWYQLDNSVVDTLNKTITGNITHFSTWVFFDSFLLQPTSARVKVNKQLDLIIVCTLPKPETAGGVITDGTLPQSIKFLTYVDGIRGGNAVVGKTSAVIGKSIRNVKYTSPASVPDNNPVALSVEATNIRWNGRNYSRLKLISNITIYDKSYEIKVTGHNKENVLQCVITSFDTSTCILQLNGNKTKLVDIQNMNQKITISNCQCNVRELNPGGSTGPVNIVGAAKITVTPANPPQKPFATVMIYFIRNMGVIAGMAVDPCLGHNGASVPGMPLPAVPFVLQFDAKDEEQTIMEGGDDKNGFKVTVKPLKEDG